MSDDNREMNIKERKFLIWLEEYLKQSLPRDVIYKAAFYAGHDEGYKDAVFDMQEKLERKEKLINQLNEDRKARLEKLNAAIEIINELFEWDNLTSNEIYKLQERFKKLVIS